jgi:hypothetical protein
MRRIESVWRSVAVFLGLIGLAACDGSLAAHGSAAADSVDDGGDAATSAAPGLQGNYGFLTNYACQSESAARGTIDTMVQTFGITDVQFYDWFASYSTPTSGAEWTDPWFHSRQICSQTIQWYIDELHLQGARAWAYVQSIAAEENNLANPAQGIYPLVNAQGTPAVLGPSGAGVTYPLYFANAAWAQHQVGVWGSAVASLGFDGIHWDTLGPIAADYGAETAGFDAFLTTAAPLLSNLGLLQTMNFVNVSWWDDSLLAVVAFPYAEVWTMAIEQQLYTAMSAPVMQSRWGVMAFYPSVDMPAGWTQSQVMVARWNEAPQHNLHYLVIGDGSERLVNQYFPSDVPLTAAEITALSQP